MSDKTTTSGEPINQNMWKTPPRHIPDNDGGAFKTELVISRSNERTEKVNWWHGPDPSRDPHSHPWPFQATILHGGYTETRYTKNDDGTWKSEERTYKVGDVNDMPAGTYHTVDSVEPGTVTHMVCGALIGEPNDWGYLIDNEEIPAEMDPEFMTKLKEINPHKR